MRCERRWRRRVPEIHFQGRRSRSSCCRRKFPPLLLGVRRRRAAREPGSPGPVSRRSPARGGRVPAASPKDAGCWPGCRNEGTSQALSASGGFRAHRAQWKFLKYILCVLWCVSAYTAQAGLVPGCHRSAPRAAGARRQLKPALSGRGKKNGLRKSKRPRL